MLSLARVHAPDALPGTGIVLPNSDLGTPTPIIEVDLCLTVCLKFSSASEINLSGR